MAGVSVAIGADVPDHVMKQRTEYQPSPEEMNRNISRACYNECLQVSKIVHLGAGCVDDYISDNLQDMIECLNDDELVPLFGTYPEQDDIDALEDASYLMERLYHKNRMGYLIEVRTPVMKPDIRFISSGGSYSWGSCYLGMFYGETLVEAINLALEWVFGMRLEGKHEAIAKCRDKADKEKAINDLYNWLDDKETRPYKI